jgi:hypothetical protein
MTTKSNTETTPAVWFSRHAPTTAQLADIRIIGHHLAETQVGMMLGAQPINTFEYRSAMMVAIRELVVKTGAQAVFGVAPTPILNAMHREVLASRRTVPFYAAWNVARSADGGKPTFEHFLFEEVGAFKVE